MEEQGALSLYAYGANSVIDGYDPDGRLWTRACCTLCAGSLAADLGGGAAGCLWGCLESKRTNYSLSECMADRIMSYLSDRLDHTQAFNLYKSAIEASSCVCCGVRLVQKYAPKIIEKAKEWQPSNKNECDELFQRALNALGSGNNTLYAYLLNLYDLWCRSPDPLPVPCPICGAGVPVGSF